MLSLTIHSSSVWQAESAVTSILAGMQTEAMDAVNNKAGIIKCLQTLDSPGDGRWDFAKILSRHA